MSYFYEFSQNEICNSRLENFNEVMRRGLRLLEEDKNRAEPLKNAVQEGIDSGIANEFDPLTHLKLLKKTKVNQS